MSKLSLLAAAATLALGLTTAFTAQATGNQKDTTWIYAVKFVCGSQSGGSFGPNFYPQVIPGFYATAINVYTPKGVKVNVGVVPTSRPGSPRPYTSPNFDPDLFANEAFKIDCKDLYRYFGVFSGTPLYKGIVYIRSKERLDVIGVYTSGSSLSRESAESIDVEQVVGRKLD